MSFPADQARKAQEFVDERKLEDAHEQRGTIVGDAHGNWLVTTVEMLWYADHTVRTGSTMRFSFLADGKEAVLSQLNRFDSAATIEMPAQSIVQRVAGINFDTWVFRVDNGYEGRDRECFDVAYRHIETGDHLLCLKQRSIGRAPSL